MAGQDATMDGGVQGFDPPVQNLGEAGQLADRTHRDASRFQSAAGASGRENRRSQVGQPLTQQSHIGLSDTLMIARIIASSSI